MRPLHHYSESTVVPVGNFDNDGQGPDAENLYADQPDPNAVTDQSRLGCQLASPMILWGPRPIFTSFEALLFQLNQKTKETGHTGSN